MEGSGNLDNEGRRDRVGYIDDERRYGRAF